jgi:D-glycero-alpha-D-manno-heptose-7-phosphate kinase
MITVRSPLRITLGGGGTDLPSYYEKHGGFCIAGAINKYVYVAINENFSDKLIVKYSEMEKVKRASDLEHPIIRECFDLLKLDGRGLEVSCMADIPAGTGLGSSSSFTCALLKALHTFKHDIISPQQLAEEACSIELGRLAEPIGKQDQYISAVGGVSCMKFGQSTEIWPLPMSQTTRDALTENLLLFFTGYSRSASKILKDQDDKSKKDDSAITANLHHVKDLGFRSAGAIENGNLELLASIMDEHWNYKQKRSGAMSNEKINEWYNLAIMNGALGGKLIGAGGGGFLLFLCESKRDLREAMAKAGLKEVRFSFDYEGTRTL